MLAKLVKCIPGGILIVPMLLSAALCTFYPAVTELGDPIGSLFSGSGLMTLLAMNLFVAGTQVKLGALPQLIKKTFFIVATRVCIAIMASYCYLIFFGMEGIYGISIIAFVAAICSTNPGIFLSLANKYGKAGDGAIFPVLSFITQPLIPLFILSMGEGGSLDLQSVISLFLPFIIGMLLAHFYENIRTLFAKATLILLPFWGISVGSKINLLNAFNAYESGLALTLLFLIICLVPMVITDKLVNRGDGFLPAATCSVAAVAIIVPQLAANMNVNYQPYVQLAQDQLATAVILTSLIMPFIAKALLRKQGPSVEGVEVA